jgi:succinate dehydrogenase / fumarate reductase cytochrome b subunit
VNTNTNANTKFMTWRSMVGTKAVVAASGVVLAGWIVLHLLGNLTVFRGAATADGYAAMLRRTGGLLWVVRAGLLLAAAAHVWGVAILARRARKARGWGAGATRARRRAATVGSRSMRVGGALLLAFVGYHLLHLTWGVAHPAFEEGAVYHNLVRGLASPLVALVYLAASALLGLHLSHGLWSVFGSLGLRTQGDPRRGRGVATALGATIGLLFASIPLAVVAGVLR